MDHADHSGHHDHPATFDDVIARGFPHADLARLAKANETRIRPGATLRAPLPKPTTTFGLAPPALRRDQASLSVPSRNAFKAAVTRLVANGTYLHLVGDHMDMSHNMHGSMGEVGLYRFLAWHRRYLVEFERELRRVDAILHPGASSTLAVPYWRWQDPFPTWLQGCLPAPDPVSGNPPPARKNAPPKPKPTAADVDTIIHRFPIQNTGLPGENDYTRFTWGLEGWGKRADGTYLPAHNHGHSWVGGIMNNTSTSPTDPIFWLHHAQVDRLWTRWRTTHPAPAPKLSGADRIMDPWSETYDDLLDPATLGYQYDSLAL